MINKPPGKKRFINHPCSLTILSESVRREGERRGGGNKVVVVLVVFAVVANVSEVAQTWGLKILARKQYLFVRLSCAHAVATELPSLLLWLLSCVIVLVAFCAADGCPRSFIVLVILVAAVGCDFACCMCGSSVSGSCCC